MKKSLTNMLTMLLALVLTLSISAVFADDFPATPTDLVEEQQDTAPAAEAESSGNEDDGEKTGADENGAEQSGNSAEIIVTKFVRLGDTWSGQVTGEKPALLKLDTDPQTNVHLIVESRQAVRATVTASDRPEDVLKSTMTDTRMGIMTLSWTAEKNSYLIHILPEGAGSVRVRALFMDDEQYALWEAEQAAAAEQEQSEEQPEELPEEIPAEQQDEQPGEPSEELPKALTEELPEALTEEQPEKQPGEQTEETTEEATEDPPEESAFALPENRSVHIDLTWDTDHPQIGDTAHFTSVMTGYDGLTYSLQWQISRDGETWDDYPGATEPQLDVVLTEEMDGVLFSLVVYVEDARPAE